MCAMAKVVLAVTHALALHSNMSHEQPHKQDIPEHVCNGSGCGSSETQSCKPYRLIGNPKVKLELGMGQINLLAGRFANHNLPSWIRYPFVVFLDILMRPIQKETGVVCPMGSIGAKQALLFQWSALVLSRHHLLQQESMAPCCRGGLGWQPRES